MGSGAGRALARAAHAALSAAAVLCLFSLSAAGAQPARSLAEVERARRAADGRAAEAVAAAGAARAELSNLRQRLAAVAARISETENAAKATDSEIAALAEAIDQAETRMRRERGALESALAATAVFSRDPSDARSGLLFAVAAQDQAARTLSAAKALETLKQRDGQSRQAALLLAAARTDLDAERQGVETLLARRRAASAQLSAEAQSAQTRARQLASEAHDLRELASRATRPRSPGARRPSTQRAAVARSALPASWRPPIAGEIVSRFGAQRGGAPATTGVRVRTAPGARVVAPAPAEIAYAGLFRSYGEVLILNLDDGYALVLAGLHSLEVQTGQTAAAGAAIATMPSTAAPELYIEVRRDGAPVDPAAWLNAATPQGPARAAAGERNRRAG